MRMLDLFSGIGGFSLAALWTWGKELDILGFCENDPFCKKKLSELFSGVPIYEDIKKLKGEQFRPVDIITGGEPCQPHSLAGKRKGKKDDRYLWPEMFRVIQKARPNWIVNENVTGSISNGVVDRKCDDLESEGYTCQAYDIPAIAVGAPHIRHRIWIVAHNESTSNGKHYTEKSNGQIRQLGISVKPANVANAKSGESRQQAEQKGREDIGGRSEIAPNTDKFNGNKPGFRASKISQFEATGIFPVSNWIAEPELGRVAHGIPNRVDRLKGLGNAIVPQVATVIMQAIKEIEKKE